MSSNSNKDNKGGEATYWKQFLMSLFATTISIALTFGTAAVTDYHKKKNEKREIVMMVMYDLYNSLREIEKADTMIRQSMDVQLQLAEDTTRFESLRFSLVHLLPKVEYTETVERIFSSSIETINTVDNLLFTENVADFYLKRDQYKTFVCDSALNMMTDNLSFSSINQTLEFDYFTLAMVSGDILAQMKSLYAQCKQMMNITDDELEAYRKKRKNMNENMNDASEAKDSLLNELKEYMMKLSELKSKLQLEDSLQ